MTPQCDVKTCTKKNVHIVYKITLLPLNVPREYQNSVGKLLIRLCPEHFDLMMPQYPKFENNEELPLVRGTPID